MGITISSSRESGRASVLQKQVSSSNIRDPSQSYDQLRLSTLRSSARAGGVLQHLILKEVSCPFRDHPLDVFSHSSSDKNTIS